MPYMRGMQTVLFTETFVRQAAATALDDDAIMEIAIAIASNPESGGYRTIHYFGGEDVPVFVLSVYGKGAKANLTQAEKNALAKILPRIASAYRSSTRSMR